MSFKVQRTFEVRCTGHLSNNKIGHLAKKKIGHLSNTKIRQMTDASGRFLLYNKFTLLVDVGRGSSSAAPAPKNIIGHLSNVKLPQMPDVSGGFF